MEQVAQYADQRAAPWGKEAFQIYLEYQKVHSPTITTEEFAIFVRWCSTTRMKQFLQSRGSKVTITGDVAGAIVQNRLSGDLILQQLLRDRELGVEVEHNAAIKLIRKLGTPVLHWLLLYRPEKFTDKVLLVGEVLDQCVPEVERRIRNPLPFAAEMGYKGAVELWLERGTSIEETSNVDGTGPTALILAVASSHKDVASYLVEHGANIEAVDESGRTPLILAAERNYELSEMLLNAGSRIDATDNNRRTPLMSASRSGSLSVTDMLIKRGAPIDSTDREGRTALMDAALEGHYDVVNQLLRKSANETMVDRLGETALTMALKKGHVKVIQEFEDHKRRNGQYGGFYSSERRNALTGLSDILSSKPKATSLNR
jgi:ankyrin repeat protein